VLVGEKSSDDLSVVGQDGENAGELYEQHQAALQASASLAIEFGRPVLRGPEDADAVPDLGPLCCVPIGSGGPSKAALCLLGDTEDAVDSVATLAALGSVALRNSELQDMQRNFFVQMTDLLVSALDQHLDYHEGHSKRVAHLANRIGHALRFEDEALERLHFASLLHDIGMLKIPVSQHGDRNMALKHPALGHRMLSAIRVWESIAPFVLYHHEWYDGSGYPEGLAGEDIPLEARVIGLAEAVDSMVSETSYKDSCSVEEMCRRVRECSGTQFDPEIARVFLDLVESGDLPLAG
jgi:HD-GYP domain-containing protein (c-di-GMP phosphodiesterase class II)